MNTETIERIKAFMNHLELTSNAFAKSISVDPSNFNKMLSGNQTISKKTIDKISNRYPELNKKWLLTGEGDMLKDVSVQQTSYGDHSPNVNGDGNTIAGDASIDHALSEIAEYRKLLERSLTMLEKRDAQIDHLIALLQDKK